mmetsp:Transcript_58293/g.153362  ORF Transcript_58293/g.153362 Transcript_58293/m.153362 type:complete len:98 (-) Transcript_58293:1-294(-)
MTCPVIIAILFRVLKSLPGIAAALGLKKSSYIEPVKAISNLPVLFPTTQNVASTFSIQIRFDPIRMIGWRQIHHRWSRLSNLDWEKQRVRGLLRHSN